MRSEGRANNFFENTYEYTQCSEIVECVHSFKRRPIILSKLLLNGLELHTSV